MEAASAAALSRMAEELDASQKQVAALQQSNTEMAEQLTAISSAIERGLSL